VRLGVVPMKLEEIVKQAIIQALIDHRFNFTKAAQSLGIGKSTLYAKLYKYDLKVIKDLGPGRPTYRLVDGGGSLIGGGTNQ